MVSHNCGLDKCVHGGLLTLDLETPQKKAKNVKSVPQPFFNGNLLKDLLLQDPRSFCPLAHM